LLIDSFAWVEFFNGTEKGTIVRRLLDENACFTSAICLAELSEWIEKEKLDKARLLDVKSLSSIIPLDNDTLELAGVIKVSKRHSAKNFGLIDAIVLATAKQFGLKIVTGDKHFKEENVLLI
jgi:predicted nucleic acid-binding protein